MDVEPAVATRLRGTAESESRSLASSPEDEGGGSVRQVGSALYLPMAECAHAVVEVATELVSQLSIPAEATGFPPVPFFNEVTWTRYPEGEGHITAHRDPSGVGGVIAVFTLEGGASTSVVPARRTSRSSAAWDGRQGRHAPGLRRDPEVTKNLSDKASCEAGLYLRSLHEMDDIAAARSALEAWSEAGLAVI
ncbi:hypothetical protein [Actinopolymorpha sp. B9G3]|uniref:hypothetical protein n=1 Tax=Actinopolymorpha sp. B9G3 TaxID=3158970 RepID=UPI0032D9539A